MYAVILTGKLNHVSIELSSLFAPGDTFKPRVMALTYERKLAVDTSLFVSSASSVKIFSEPKIGRAHV